MGGILHGEVDSDIAGLRRRTAHKGLTGAKKKNLRAIFAYLEKNKHRMCYDKYVRLACPVTTGVIEGACHHVIKDRMGRAGIRWKIPGAQAMSASLASNRRLDWTFRSPDMPAQVKAKITIEPPKPQVTATSASYATFA